MTYNYKLNMKNVQRFHVKFCPILTKQFALYLYTNISTSSFSFKLKRQAKTTVNKYEYFLMNHAENQPS